MNPRSSWALGSVLLSLGVAGNSARTWWPRAHEPSAGFDELQVSLSPQPAYLELGEAGLLGNWDLIVENASDLTWTLTELRLSAFDRGGALEWRKFLDESGVAPSLWTLPVREVPAGERILVMNPLYAFPRDLELARVRFELTFEVPGRRTPEPRTVSIEVAPRRYEAHAELRLPLEGRLLVWDGHDYYAHHRRWDYTAEPLPTVGFDSNAGRYSYDFVPVDESGAMVHGDEDDNASWIGFGQPVHATAAGTVVAVVDDRPDDRSIDLQAVTADLRNAFGNYVIVDHGHGEHSVFGHIRQGSAKVAVGDEVAPGQALAAIGASGSSLFPHLHYQLQDGPSGHAEGLPSTFHDFVRVRGTRKLRMESGPVDSGDLLEGGAVR